MLDEQALNSQRPRTPLLLAVLVTLCTGCTGIIGDERDEQEDYLGWHCSGDVDSQDNWHCEQRVDEAPMVPPISSYEAEERQFEFVEESVNVDSIPAGEPNAVFDLKLTGFTLQFGAFARREGALRATEELGRRGIAVAVVPLSEEGDTVHLLLSGNYPLREEARAASERILARNPGVTSWVRSMDTLK